MTLVEVEYARQQTKYKGKKIHEKKEQVIKNSMHKSRTMNPV
jgi:hypothetical protein